MSDFPTEHSGRYLCAFRQLAASAAFVCKSRRVGNLVSSEATKDSTMSFVLKTPSLQRGDSIKKSGNFGSNSHVLGSPGTILFLPKILLFFFRDEAFSLWKPLRGASPCDGRGVLIRHCTARLKSCQLFSLPIENTFICCGWKLATFEVLQCPNSLY
jgi:hypothetical protein